MFRGAVIPFQGERNRSLARLNSAPPMRTSPCGLQSSLKTTAIRMETFALGARYLNVRGYGFALLETELQPHGTSVAKPKESSIHGAIGGQMIPGIPGGRMNPRQLKAAMKRMGIETEELADVDEIVIRTATKEYVFKSAEVSTMTVQGQKTWQIVGEPIVMNRKTEGAAPEK